MRFTGITAVFLAALVTDHVHATERCTNQLTNDWSRRYEAWSNSWVPNADAVCGNLWSNLGQYPECAGVSDQYCGYDNSGSSLVWAFTTGSGCKDRRTWDVTVAGKEEGSVRIDRHLKIVYVRLKNAIGCIGLL
ncbi:hypothetical protein FocTR4_00013732 [Fusarium oxysporum f. sp. cubense]|uniref:Uncharacterized protein n=1 Tax=Fusarium oxysporum f. sp. cubense TaxID=61366 RepID=A0A5C6SNA7_FUSOC|nr:hypothetical protein FocTR4_00013732 [Fusarium oxysporum f. sp. cubense]